MFSTRFRKYILLLRMVDSNTVFFEGGTKRRLPREKNRASPLRIWLEEGPKGAHSVMTRVNADDGIVAVRPLMSHS